tara:strand:- start:4597 stop:5010 length:414 start_codon:yes stop_codon:yes gene_type:complete
MTFEKSKYGETLQHFKLEKPFGNFYLCEHFFVAELNEGIHFDWSMIKNVMKDLIVHYGEDKKLGYISNRVNSYSMNPHNWNKVYNTYGMIQASAIVYYNDIMQMNAALEKQLSDKSIKRCRSLKEAVDWMLGLKEFQ